MLASDSKKFLPSSGYATNFSPGTLLDSASAHPVQCLLRLCHTPKSFSHHIYALLLTQLQGHMREQSRQATSSHAHAQSQPAQTADTVHARSR